MNTKLKRIENGLYEGAAFYGLKAKVERDDEGNWGWTLFKPARTEYVSTGEYSAEKIEHPVKIVAEGGARTKAAAEKAIDTYGRTTMVTVKNIMSGKDFETPIGVAGTFLCPSSERYWSM